MIENKKENIALGKNRMDGIIPEVGPLTKLDADEIKKGIYEFLIGSIEDENPPSQEKMNREIKAELESSDADKETRYIVVKFSSPNALLDEQVWRLLFHDLGPELRIIFHDAGSPNDDIFNVSETRFNRNLLRFLDIE